MNKINRVAFRGLLESLHQRELILNNTKGQEYAGFDDVLANFRETSEDIKEPIRKVIYTHLHKHWAAVRYYCNTGTLESTETLESRINDLRLYLALLRAAQMEEENWELVEVGAEEAIDWQEGIDLSDLRA